MQTKLIKKLLILVVLLGLVLAAFLRFRSDKTFVNNTATTDQLTTETVKKTEEVKKPADESAKSIDLEKPPFIK